ncbi:permease-like cell division protein FtsX [Cellulosilyticum ruminicola]|uniref:permease-like cell division protein FtsX n=1 Tax=Cellulosilyticum ruminicola TaxID=425254 RepID=UPI0006D16EC5|nr:permease-like cell division protein FtsX [Cellulosilyticum ruminicola]
MSWNTLRYLFKEGIIGLWKNKTMALASAGTIVLCLLILGMSYAIGMNIDSLLKQVENKFGITCYVDEDINEGQIQQIKKQIEGISSVKEVKYVSKEEALKSFSEESDDVSIFEDFKEDNPLPASFEITVYDIEQQEAVVAALKQLKGIEAQYLKQETQMFINLNKTIDYICIGIIICLIIVGLLLMSNTIKLTVYVRRKEINIMKYIGATDWFIRLPFLIEGTTIGLVSALIAITAIAFSYDFINKKIAIQLMNSLEGISLVSTTIIINGMIPICLGLGISIGLVGSAFAIRKHLQV